MRRVLPSLLLSAVVSAGCPGDLPGSPFGSGPHLPARWQHDLSGGQGVAVHPTTGAVYVSVGTSTQAPFTEGGGIEVFAPDGAKVTSVPMVLDACEGCVRLRFSPKGPQITPDGRHVYVSDLAMNLFRLETGSLQAEQMAVPGASWLTLVSVNQYAALSPDGKRAYLPGSRLTTIELDDGSVSESDVPTDYVRQIVPYQGQRYLVNLTPANWGDTGTVGIWDANTGELTTATLPSPVRGLATRDGWTVGIVETGVTSYQAVELDFSSQPPRQRVLGAFRLEGGSEISMAIRPGKKQVVVGTSSNQGVIGGMDAGASQVVTLPGSTLLIDAERGPVAKADTSSVKGLALSPDGNTLYVVDTGGVKAFALP